MRAIAGTWIVLIFGLITLLKAQQHTVHDYRKHFYKDSSERKQAQKNSEEQLIDDVEELDVRPKRVVESDRKKSGFLPEWFARFYVESKESVCDEDGTTTKKHKKKGKCKCCKTTTEQPRTTTTKRTVPQTSTTTALVTTRKPRKTTTKAKTSTAASTTTPVSTTEQSTTIPPKTTTSPSTTSTPDSTTTKPASTTATPPPPTTTSNPTSTTSSPKTSSSTTPESDTPCPYPPNHPIFSKKHHHHLLPPACTTTTSAPTTRKPRHPLAIVIPDFLEDSSASSNRELMKRILRRLHRLGPKAPFSRPAHGLPNRLKKSPSFDSEQTSSSQQADYDSGHDDDGDHEEAIALTVAPKRVVGVRPAVMSYDRVRDSRDELSTGGGRRCRRSKEDREYVRYLRNMLREAKREMRMRKNMPC